MRKKDECRRRVVIVDKHPLVRRGLMELLDAEPDLRVCAEDDSPRAALEDITVTKADLVITGLSLSDGIGDGLALVADIRAQHPELPVLVLSMHDGSRWADRAREAGASGFLSKQEIGENLLGAVRALLDGKKVDGKKVD